MAWYAETRSYFYHSVENTLTKCWIGRKWSPSLFCHCSLRNLFENDILLITENANLCISKCSIYIEQPRKIKTSFFFHGRNEKLWNCISVYIFIQIKESEIPLPEVKMPWWVTEINRAWNRSRGMKPFTAVSWLIHYSRLILPVHINGLALTIFISEIVFRVKKNNVVYDRFNCSHQLYTILLLSNCRLDTCF